MHDRDEEYDEFSDVWSKNKGNAPAQIKAATLNRTTVSSGHESYEKQLRAKRRKNRKRKKIIASVLILAILILILITVLICKSCTEENDVVAELSGVWLYDQHTEYEFDGRGNGCMCLDGSNHYEFTYKTENGIMHIDFSLDYVTDCKYTYSVEGDTLTLVGGEGTAEVGKVYELTKE